MLIDYGETIRQRRRDYGLTQAELAEQANVNTQTIGTIENNLRIPRLDTLLMVLKALDLTIELVEVAKS